MIPEGPGPRVEPLPGPFGFALSIDLEEWYHTCWEPDYVAAERRPRLVEELDREIPRLLERLAAAQVRGTFFVLGEVAARWPGQIRAIASAGHEIASHGWSHRRVTHLGPAEFALEAGRSKVFLEDLVGAAVLGYRSPEWSLRSVRHPSLERLVALGYSYDASLTRAIGAGRPGNPAGVSRLAWPSGATLLELPPLLLWRRVPAGGWTGRLAPPEWIARAAERHRSAGGLPLLVVHPWELVERPTPGLLSAGARAIQDVGRLGYPERFDALLRTHRWGTISTRLEQAAEFAGPPASR
jgi:peptidoglycan/xylan/chitin deacetylase (PgdA/CDA1 family)